MSEKKSIANRMETIFDLIYLILVLIVGVYMIVTSSDSLQRLWGIMGLVLVFGDSFHLVPRILAAKTGDIERYRKALGTGKQITSITMTLFYLLLWHIGLMILGLNLTAFTCLVWILAVIRIVLCLSPKNAWTDREPDYRWGIYRNIPFFFEGLMVCLLFGLYTNKLQGMGLMWLAIFLSFAFYIPVVLFSQKHPKVGILMLPKTCMYVWIIFMGFFLPLV